MFMSQEIFIVQYVEFPYSFIASFSRQLRAYWYLLEVIAQEDSEFVLVVWAENLTIWDFDRKTDSQLIELEMRYLPVRISASHVCCPPFLAAWVIRPIAFALQEKRLRQRTMIHDVSPNQILSVMAEYGIFEDMLPNFMGGTIQLDQSEWIANRRSVEAEGLKKTRAK